MEINSEQMESSGKRLQEEEEQTWQLIDTFFKDNPDFLVKHQLDSYNQFMEHGIKQIFRERNHIKIYKELDDKKKIYKHQCNVYLGGKDGSKLYYGKPVIYDKDNEHFMYPNEARLRNMTYGITIHYDIDVEFTVYEDLNQPPITYSHTVEKQYLGKFPIMLQSNLCILHGLDSNARYNMGECMRDPGGYFIVDGSEKVIVSQEKFADNMLYIKKHGDDDIYTYSAEMRTVSEDSSKPLRTFGVRIVAPSTSYTNNQIVVSVPNVKKPVPLCILFRALGVLSDKEILEYCLLDLDKNAAYLDHFIPSIHDAAQIFTQESALSYIATLTKGATIVSVLEILTNYFMPNVGEMNFKEKAYSLGYIVYRLMRVALKEDQPTDRDNYKYKRVELPGMLLYDLFREYYNIQYKYLSTKINKIYYFKPSLYQGRDYFNLIQNNVSHIFDDANDKDNRRIIEKGMMDGFKGRWGSEEHTHRDGVVQALNRLSFFTFLCHLRKVVLPLSASAKVTGPHHLHGSQWGYMDPIDSPDGGNVGLHKHFAISTLVTTNESGKPMIDWIKRHYDIVLLSDTEPGVLYSMTRVIVNGNWIGSISDPIEFVKSMKVCRRNGLIPAYASIAFDITYNVVYIYTDGGRVTRPIFYVEKGKRSSIPVKARWNELVSGTGKKKIEGAINNTKYYEIADMYDVEDIKEIKKTSACLDYIDCSEEESSLIAIYSDDLTSRHTHLEIHPSFLFGVMTNLIMFPENNPFPRNVFSTGQSRQAVSLYHTNFSNRVDKMGVTLNSGQIPLVKTRYAEYIHGEQIPYGENAIVAIMCHGGYNVEDAILVNEGSLKRGIFRTTYYTTYETFEETTVETVAVENKVSGVGELRKQTVVKTKFGNTMNENVVGIKPGYDYSYLDESGMVLENTEINDKTVLIGMMSVNPDTPGIYKDISVTAKKGQLGYVDKAFITIGEEGTRIGKIRVREERMPGVGDKMASRAGQKGIVGQVIPEKDMPFCTDGTKPDLIINPHAIPSRMTICQLLECILGKSAAVYGYFGDSTAYCGSRSGKDKLDIFGKLLTQAGYHSSGNQVLYNGMTGEQIENEIFIGPTYYMRLKHMVKDKINYRERGPRTILTRQPVQGRANDGGLRIGEMERDGIIAHGAASFLNESMMVRGDEYSVAICNKTGMIAIHNQATNQFLSPFVDGPLKFDDTLEGKKLDTVSKFGREFSIVRVPYAFKLLIQELQAMNVQMRIITEDNIDQLESMLVSSNATTLLKRIPELSDSYVKMIEANPDWKSHMSRFYSRLEGEQQKTGEIKREIKRNPVAGVAESESESKTESESDIKPIFKFSEELEKSPVEEFQEHEDVVYNETGGWYIDSKKPDGKYKIKNMNDEEKTVEASEISRPVEEIPAQTPAQTPPVIVNNYIMSGEVKTPAVETPAVGTPAVGTQSQPVGTPTVASQPAAPLVTPTTSIVLSDEVVGEK